MGEKVKRVSYQEMVTQAVLNIKDNKGASRQAIKKYVEANYMKVGQQSALRKAAKALVASGVLIPQGPQRFRLDKDKRKALRNPPKPKKKVTKKKPKKKKTTKKKKPAKKSTKKKKPAKKSTKKKKARQKIDQKEKGASQKIDQ